jgi:hypothetical protein
VAAAAAAAQYHPSNQLLQLSLKIHGMTPDQLPSNALLQLSRAVTGVPLAVESDGSDQQLMLLQAGVRNGCIMLEMDLMAESTAQSEATDDSLDLWSYQQYKQQQSVVLDDLSSAARRCRRRRQAAQDAFVRSVPFRTLVQSLGLAPLVPGGLRSDNGCVTSSSSSSSSSSSLTDGSSRLIQGRVGQSLAARGVDMETQEWMTAPMAATATLSPSAIATGAVGDIHLRLPTLQQVRPSCVCVGNSNSSSSGDSNGADCLKAAQLTIQVTGQFNVLRTRPALTAAEAAAAAAGGAAAGSGKAVETFTSSTAPQLLDKIFVRQREHYLKVAGAEVLSIDGRSGAVTVQVVIEAASLTPGLLLISAEQQQHPETAQAAAAAASIHNASSGEGPAAASAAVLLTSPEALGLLVTDWQELAVELAVLDNIAAQDAAAAAAAAAASSAPWDQHVMIVQQLVLDIGLVLDFGVTPAAAPVCLQDAVTRHTYTASMM